LVVIRLAVSTRDRRWGSTDRSVGAWPGVTLLVMHAGLRTDPSGENTS